MLKHALPLVLVLCVLTQLTTAANTCAQHDTCAFCVSSPECGWCSFGVGKCLSGTLHGPSSQTNCSAWDYGFCAGQPCSVYIDDCTCTHDPFCGWCVATATCTEGTSHGPILPVCDYSEWIPYPGAERCNMVPGAAPVSMVASVSSGGGGGGVIEAREDDEDSD
eukprot:c2057_g1_i1.p1 GENE.c2057_g1_i1~~c2057_g1_i1.p1  ORF type:complete len:174 (+),score=36.94 c2057_g1_i1:33-524(+)